jgi:hypothetical protein
MIKILPRHREEIETLVDELESTEFAKADDSQVAPIVKRLRDFFCSYGTEQLRSQYDRTRTALGRSDICLELSVPNNITIPRGGKRDFIGKSGKNMIRVSGYSNFIFFQRLYPGFKMSWKLNSQGRIECVDVLVFQEGGNKAYTLARNYEFWKKPSDWDFGIMEFLQIPREINSINPTFKGIEPDHRYQALMRYGHSMAKEFFERLEYGKVTDHQKLKPGQEGLTRLRDDLDFLDIIAKAGNILPYVVGRDGRLAMVEYLQNERSIRST